MLDNEYQKWDINKGDYKRDYQSTNRYLKKQERTRMIRQTLLIAITVAVLVSALYGIFHLMSD